MGVIDSIPAQAPPPQAPAPEAPPPQTRPTRAEVQAQARQSHRKDAEADAGPSDHKGRRKSTAVLAVLLVVLVAVVVAYVSISDSIDYVHGFGRACLIALDGWHFHARCGSVSPPHP